MISAADMPTSVPYAQECDPDLLPLLPEGTYLKCVFKGGTQVMRTGPVIAHNGGRYLECDSSRVWSIFLARNIKSFTPLTPPEAFAFYPQGTKINVYVKNPTTKAMALCSGIVIGHLQKRVKVRLFPPGGNAFERSYYPTQLRKV